MSNKFKVVLVSLRRDTAIRLRVPANTPDEVVIAAIEQNWDDTASYFVASDGLRLAEVMSADTDAIVVDSQAATDPLAPNDAKRIVSFWLVEQANVESTALAPSDEAAFTITLTREDLAAAGFCSDVDAETFELLRDVLEGEIQEEHFRAALVAACEELGIERVDDGGAAHLRLRLPQVQM